MNVYMEESGRPNKVVDLASRCQITQRNVLRNQSYIDKGETDGNDQDILIKAFAKLIRFHEYIFPL